MKVNRTRRKNGGLVLHQGGAGRDEPPIVIIPETLVELCGRCHGPSFLCRLDHDQHELGEASPIERRWVAALRAMHIGLALCSTPAAGMGGALLLLGRRLVAGTAMPEPDALVQAAPDPEGGLPRALATTYALTALVERESSWARPSARAARVLGKQRGTPLDVLQALAAAMSSSRAKWVRETVALAHRAALASPFLVHETFPLVAAVCEGCATTAPHDEGAVAWERFMRPVELYDTAIRCPVCMRLHEHPLPFSATNPRLPWPPLHPIARCQRGECPTGIGCVTHGLPIGADALCDDGRHVYQQAQAHIAVRMGEKTPLEPWESRVMVALVMAGQRARVRAVARDATGAPPQTFADELTEALAQMQHDLQGSLPLLRRILPAPLLSMFALLGTPTPPRPALTAGRRFDLTATRGDDAAEYPNKAAADADRIERELLAEGWTVTRKPATSPPPRPGRRR